MFKHWALVAALLAPSLAAAGDDACKGVKVARNDFGGSKWSAEGFYGMTLFELAKTGDTLVLKMAAQTKALTTAVVTAGATAEIAFEDGTVWRETTKSDSPGVVMTTTGGSFWYFTVSIDAEKLKQLATSRIKNARLVVGDQSYGDAWFVGGATASLQRAAACYATL